MLKPAEYKKLASDKKVVLNWVCAVLMIVLLIMQFVPYWSFEVEIPVMRTEIVEPEVEEPIAEEVVAEEAEPAEEVAEATEEPVEEVAEEAAEGEEAVPEETAEEAEDAVAEEPAEEAAVAEEPEIITVEVLDHMKKDKRSVSINGYVWLPFNHEACDEYGISDPEANKPGMSGLENYFNNELDGSPIKVKKVMWMPIAYLIIAILAILVALSDPKKLAIPVFALVGGVAAVIGYITIPVFALSSMMIVHIIIAALVALAGLGTIIYRIINKEPKIA